MCVEHIRVEFVCECSVVVDISLYEHKDGVYRTVCACLTGRFDVCMRVQRVCNRVSTLSANLNALCLILGSGGVGEATENWGHLQHIHAYMSILCQATCTQFH